MNTRTQYAKICSALVRSRDEDRWLSARYAPRVARDRLNALYALVSEIELTTQRVSEAPLGEIRLQWWREALHEIASGKPTRAHPVLNALIDAEIEAGLIVGIERVIDARARLLYPPAFTSAEDFATWCNQAEGRVAETAWRLLTAGVDAAAQPARTACVAYAIARDASRLAPDVADGAMAIAREMRIAAREALPCVPSGAMPAIAHCALTDVRLGNLEPGPILKRLLIFRAVLRGRI